MNTLNKRRRLVAMAFLLISAAGMIGANTIVTRFGTGKYTSDIVIQLPEFDFHGEKPVLKVLSGDKQPPVSGFLPLPVVIAVYHSDGTTAWPKAPVTLSVEYGKGGWARTSGGTVSANLTFQSDDTGKVQAYYWMP